MDGNTFAARLCNEYSVTVGGIIYGDWYLPSKHELNLLYLQKNVVGGFASDGYWSSSEFNAGGAWRFGPGTGTVFNSSKNGLYYVRAVRVHTL